MAVRNASNRFLLSWLIYISLLSAFAVVFSGCATRFNKMNVEVVVFNYNSEPIVELVVQGNYLGGFYGGYGPGGTGGSSYCCIEVVAGEAEVRWRYSGREGEPRLGVDDRATAVIPEPIGEPRYLGVHISSDSTVELRLTEKYPLDKKYD